MFARQRRRSTAVSVDYYFMFIFSGLYVFKPAVLKVILAFDIDPWACDFNDMHLGNCIHALNTFYVYQFGVYSSRILTAPTKEHIMEIITTFFLVLLGVATFQDAFDK